MQRKVQSEYRLAPSPTRNVKNGRKLLKLWWKIQYCEIALIRISNFPQFTHFSTAFNITSGTWSKSNLNMAVK